MKIKVNDLEYRPNQINNQEESIGEKIIPESLIFFSI